MSPPTGATACWPPNSGWHSPATVAAGPRTCSVICASTARANSSKSCQRDGEKENYLSPEDHRIGVRLAGPAPAGATCAWNFDDSTPPPQQVTVPCTEEVRLRVRYGRTTVATVGITRADNSVDSAAADIIVQDLLIAGLGDSVAAGEGNPDRPVALADDGFCFRRFLGSGEYFRPSRAGYKGNKACDDAAGGPESRGGRAAIGSATPRAGCPPLATIRFTDIRRAPRWRWRSRTRTSR